MLLRVFHTGITWQSHAAWQERVLATSNTQLNTAATQAAISLPFQLLDRDHGMAMSLLRKACRRRFAPHETLLQQDRSSKASKVHCALLRKCPAKSPSLSMTLSCMLRRRRQVLGGFVMPPCGLLRDLLLWWLGPGCCLCR